MKKERKPKRNQQIHEYFNRLSNAERYLEGLGYTHHWNSAGELYWHNPNEVNGSQVLLICQSANGRYVIVQGHAMAFSPLVVHQLGKPNESRTST